jgi:hypothetical protein
VEVYGFPTAGQNDDFAVAQPFDFAGWTLLASAPSSVSNLQKSLPSVYNRRKLILSEHQ